MLNNNKNQNHLNEIETNESLKEQRLIDELEITRLNKLSKEISYLEEQEKRLADKVDFIKEIEFVDVDEKMVYSQKPIDFTIQQTPKTVLVEETKVEPIVFETKKVEPETVVIESKSIEVEPKNEVETVVVESKIVETEPKKDAETVNKSIKELAKETALKEKEKKKAAKSQFKNLSKEEKDKIKARLKEIKKMNSPHKGPKDVEFKNSDNIIELTDVRKYYSNGFLVTEILKGIDLEIRNGDFVIILGPSGSGKTTLMNIISGLDRASSGIVNVAGKNLICFSDAELTKFRKDNVGYVFQQYGLLPNLTVKENIEIGQQLQTDKSKRKPIEDIVRSVGLLDHINKFPHQLSGGQQQRVSIARAFAKNPTILFGDEPTGAIDEEMSKMVLKEFVNINKEYKTTIIIVTHNPIFADLGSLVIRIKDGSIHQCIRNENPKSVDELPWGQE